MFATERSEGEKKQDSENSKTFKRAGLTELQSPDFHTLMEEEKRHGLSCPSVMGQAGWFEIFYQNQNSKIIATKERESEKKSVLLGFCFGEVSRGQGLILLSSYIWVRAEAVKLTHQASTHTRFFQTIQEWLRCSKVAPHLSQLFATKIRSNFNYSTDWSFSDRFSKEPNKEKCPVPIKR